MNEVVIEAPRREMAGLMAGEVHRFSAVEIRERVNLVQSVMQGIMKRDTHYGTIPGTPKPTLYKPGAEVLCVTFRIAQEYRVEDLGDATTSRYRVTCVGRHQVTGLVLGEGVGECSSAEEKYKWRGSVCSAEFDATPETMRRLKFFKNGDKRTQVRTEAADMANTVLKMACKRAMIAMTLNVTAASDIFTQDIEDLPEELRPHEAGDHGQQKTGASTELPTCPDEAFKENEPTWRKLVESGKKTPAALIAMLSTRATLSEAQKKTINGWKKQEAATEQQPTGNDNANP